MSLLGKITAAELGVLKFGINIAMVTSKADSLRWLDTVSQGQYLPILSINYVAINHFFEKLPPQLY